MEMNLQDWITKAELVQRRLFFIFINRISSRFKFQNKIVSAVNRVI